MLVSDAIVLVQMVDQHNGAGEAGSENVYVFVRIILLINIMSSCEKKNK